MLHQHASKPLVGLFLGLFAMLTSCARHALIPDNTVVLCSSKLNRRRGQLITEDSQTGTCSGFCSRSVDRTYGQNICMTGKKLQTALDISFPDEVLGGDQAVEIPEKQRLQTPLQRISCL